MTLLPIVTLQLLAAINNGLRVCALSGIYAAARNSVGLLIPQAAPIPCCNCGRKGRRNPTLPRSHGYIVLISEVKYRIQRKIEREAAGLIRLNGDY